MKSILISLSVLLLSIVFNSCKKSDDVDPREQYLGTYSVTANSLAGTTNQPVAAISNLTNDVLEVTRSDADNGLSFTLAGKRFSLVSLDGSYFFFTMSEKAKASNGSEYWVNYDGTGAFSGKDVSMNLAVDYTVSGVNVKSIIAIKGKKK